MGGGIQGAIRPHPHRPNHVIHIKCVLEVIGRELSVSPKVVIPSFPGEATCSSRNRGSIKHTPIRHSDYHIKY